MKTAIITGIRGQDGLYMTERLLQHGYRVIGLVRDGGDVPGNDGSVVPASVDLLTWDMRDSARIEQILRDHRPSEFYNFAAFSSGSGMYDQPAAIGDINGLAIARILDALRSVSPATRFCQASSSEMFGDSADSPQREDTPFVPRSPYGAAKLYAHSMINIYRRRYGLFVCSAILFNHESPLRSQAFVTRKVSHAAAGIKVGLVNKLTVGNLDSRRDWGFAGDYVRAMHLMLQARTASDYVIATGITHSVRDLCEIAFRHVGLDYRDHVLEDPDAFRPNESLQLVGDPSKAAQELGWTAELQFPELIRLMVDADLVRLGAR